MNKIYAVLLFLICICSSNGQEHQNTMQFSVDHYAINVTNLQRSVNFYQSVFGIKEIHNGTEKSHIRWFRLGNRQELHIISVEHLNLQIPKGVHLALTTADIPLFVEHLKTLNVSYFDWPGKENAISVRPDKVKQVYIQDPDGYWIEINDGEKRFK